MVAMTEAAVPSWPAGSAVVCGCGSQVVRQHMQCRSTRVAARSKVIRCQKADPKPAHSPSPADNSVAMKVGAGLSRGLLWEWFCMGRGRRPHRSVRLTLGWGRRARCAGCAAHLGLAAACAADTRAGERGAAGRADQEHGQVNGRAGGRHVFFRSSLPPCCTCNRVSMSTSQFLSAKNGEESCVL